MSSVYENLSVEELINEALERNEGELASNGALLVKTGKRTGRSPLDRFIVKDESTENSVDWGDVNKHLILMPSVLFGKGSVSTWTKEIRLFHLFMLANTLTTTYQ